jgi:hypothetical protein
MQLIEPWNTVTRNGGDAAEGEALAAAILDVPEVCSQD